jgi:arginase family enzyme
MDIVEVAPVLDSPNATSTAAVRVIMDALAFHGRSKR